MKTTFMKLLSLMMCIIFAAVSLHYFEDGRLGIGIFAMVGSVVWGYNFINLLKE